MKEKTLKEKTAKGLLWGAVNNLATQLLGALIGIVLARKLSPDEYGMVGMLAIFSAVAGCLQESGFTNAITNLKQATHRDYNAVFWCSTLVSMTLYIILYFSAPLIAYIFGEPELIPLSRLVFASFVVAGIGTAHSAWMFRNMMNREKAVMSVVALLVSGTVGITLAMNGYSYWSLAWQQFAYIVTIDLGRLYYVRWLPSLKIDLQPIREMFGFSSKILITNIVNQVNNNMLSFIFGLLFKPKAVGDYTQAAKWNLMGYSLISSTIQQVAQPVLSSINDEEGRQLKVFRKMLRFTAFLSMPAMFGLALIADFVVLLLGAKWADSVVLLQLLCIGGAFLPIQTLYQNLFISHGRSDTYMWCTIAQIAVQTVTILSFSIWGIQTMVTAFVTVQVLWLGVWQLMARRLVGLRFLDMLKDVCPFLLSALACVGIAYVATRGIDSPVVTIIVRMVLVALLYMSVMKVARVKIFNECIQFLFKRHETTP